MKREKKKKTYTARVAADGKVTTGVHTRDALHGVLEAADGGAVLDQGQGLVGGAGLGLAGADVALQAPGVVFEAGAGAEVDGHVLEGTRGDAGAAAGRVAAQAGGVAVEHGRLGRVGDLAVPVPVGLESLVAALLAQGLFVLPHVVPVPAQEVGRVVDGRRLLDVDGQEVVEAGARAGGDAGGRLGREALQALHSRDVVLALGDGEVAPDGVFVVSMSWQKKRRKKNARDLSTHHSRRIEAFSKVQEDGLRLVKLSRFAMLESRSLSTTSAG